MNRVGFQFKIYADKLSEYKEHHKNVWPKMLDAWRETEESLSAAKAKMAVKEINTRWQEFMSPFVDSNARPDETFIELEEYFHLD